MNSVDLIMTSIKRFIDTGLTRDAIKWHFLVSLTMFITSGILAYLFLQKIASANTQYHAASELIHQEQFIVQHIAVLNQKLRHAEFQNSIQDQHRNTLTSLQNIHRQLRQHDPSNVDFPHIVDTLYNNHPLNLSTKIEEFIVINQTLSESVLNNIQQQDSLFNDASHLGDFITEQLSNISQDLHNNHLHLINTKINTISNIFLYGILIIFLLQYRFLHHPLIRIITALRANLDVAEKTKREFLTSISHEIRTPMNGIIGMAENLLGTPLNEKQHQCARTILNSSESLLDILSDILGYAEMQTLMRDAECYSFNLETLVKNLIHLLSERARKKGLEIIVDFQDGISEFVRSDPSRIRQALYHLVTNAIKFTHTGSIQINIQKSPSADVQVDMDLHQQWLRFSVEDTGIGIAPEMQEHIFKEFVQLDGSTTREFSGIGIGLAICQKLIGSLGGQLCVKSEPGKGSIFWFDIPLEFDAKGQEVATSLVFLKRLRLLLVENSSVESEWLQDQFRDAGVILQVCHTTDAALAAIAQADISGASFQIAVVSSTLPHSGAVGFAKQLQRHIDHCPFPLVALTFGENDFSVKDYVAAGFMAVLTRPTRNTILLETLAAVHQAFRQGRTHELISLDGNLLAQHSEKLLDAALPTETDESQLFAGYTLLLVEDNRINRTLVQNMLEEMGARVLCAENGEQAISQLKNNPAIHLVLMDCMMPVMDGYAATQGMRQHLAHSGRFLPIVALTANVMKGDREKCFAAGMDAYLSKPVRKKELMLMVRTWLPKQPDHTDASTFEKMSCAISPQQDEFNNEVLIDSNLLENSQKLFKQKFPTVIQYYFEDSIEYIAKIRQGMANGDRQMIIANAHPLKSSSFTLGFVAVSQTAKELEILAGEDDATDNAWSKINEIFEQLVLACQQSKIHYQQHFSHMATDDYKSSG